MLHIYLTSRKYIYFLLLHLSLHLLSNDLSFLFYVKYINFHLFYMDIHLFQNHYYAMLFLKQISIYALLVCIEFSSHWSISLALHQYHAVTMLCNTSIVDFCLKCKIGISVFPCG